MELIIQIIQNNPWFGVLTAAVALASAITAVTPTPQSGTLAKIYKLVDWAALNIGKAKQK
mgnify:FL=1|jgi:hypothetical protein|tara:strand:+ start:724 stop:903 length:180 start_codon:yes stop_codon:yes gene_type:complete